MAAIAMLEQHRRGLARALLASTEPEAALSARTAEIAALAAAAFPWDPTAEDVEIAQGILERWRQQPAPPANVVMAAMALAPAHHFPVIALARVPAWLRPLYARYLLARAPLFLHSGEADRYAAHGAAALAAVRTAVAEALPDAAELARVAAATDSTLIYFNAQSLKPYFRDKAWLAEWMMLTQGFQLGAGFPLTSGAKPRIGFLHRVLSPGTETFHLLAHLEGRDRSAAEVRIYFLDPAANAMTGAFAPWVDALVQLPNDTSAAVAQMRADRLDLCLMTNNLGWGLARETIIAAHRLAPLQAVCGACPATPGLSSSDAFISNADSDPLADAQEDYVERLSFVPGAVAHFGYAHDQDPPTVSVTRAGLGVPDDHVLFFSGANYYKIEPEILEIWAELLARTPQSSLALMPFNPNWGGAYPLALFQRRLNQVLARFGVAASRVRLVGQVPTRADLLSIMRLADVYLDSFPYSGACSLVDPLVVGLPIVAHAGSRLRTAQGATLLRGEGLESSVCPDANAYVERAHRLATEPAYREQEAAAVRQAAAAGLACLETQPFARRFNDYCLDAIAADRDRVGALRVSTPQALRLAIAKAAAAAFADAPPALRGLHGAEIVRQVLGPWLATLEVDRAPPGRVLEGDGFALLQGLNLGAATPDAIKLKFDAAIADQSPSVVGETIQEMAARGYGAAVFECRKLQRHGAAAGPDQELVDLRFDASALGDCGDACGDIIFHRADDTVFLTCVLLLLERYGPAPGRPAFAPAAERTKPPRSRAKAPA